MTARRPARRWLRGLAVVLLLAVSLLAFGIWRFAGDRARVAAFLAQQVRDSLGVELVARGEARLDWWPSPGLRLGDVTVTDAAGATLLTARSLAARVPWSTLVSRELHLGGLDLEGARFELDAIARLAAARRDDGPPAPLRWPRTDATLAVRDAVIVREDGSELRVTLELDPIAAGAPLRLRANVADGGAPLTIALDGTARAPAGGIAIDDLRAAFERAGDAAPVEVRGTLAFAATTDFSFDGEIAGRAWPAWLSGGLPGAAGAPARVDLRLARAGAGLALGAEGELAGAKIEADFSRLVLPESADLAGAIGLLATTALQGSAAVDRVGLGDVVLEGVRYESAAPDAAQAGSR